MRIRFERLLLATRRSFKSLPKRRRDAALGVALVVVFVAIAGVAFARQTSAPGAAGIPGMNMPSGGHDMSAMTGAAASAPLDARGNQPLAGTVVNGVRELRLSVGTISWAILPDVRVNAIAYNNQVPGPQLRVRAGEQVKITVMNTLREPTSVHWHGLAIPNAQDGAAGVTQPPIAPGQSFDYRFTVPNTPGTYFYHTHYAGDTQQALGLYGALVIEDGTPSAYASEQIIELGEWRNVNGQTMPAMDYDGMLPNYFTINGKSYPATETVNAKVGERILFRFIGTGQFIHPMHIHGGPFEIVATDGNPVPTAARLKKDTVLVGPGERYDVVWTAPSPGKWLLHCHINHHITNDGKEAQGAGGLTMVINVTA